MYKVSFRDIKNICVHHALGIEDGFVFSTCRDKDNIPKGCSWGECKQDKCPFLKGKEKVS